MATAKHPWEKFSNKFAAMTEIASGTTLPELPSGLSQQCVDFMMKVTNFFFLSQKSSR